MPQQAPGPQPPDPEGTRQEARRIVERYLAAVEGAVEGLLEGMESYARREEDAPGAEREHEHRSGPEPFRRFRDPEEAAAAGPRHDAPEAWVIERQARDEDPWSPAHPDARSAEAASTQDGPGAASGTSGGAAAHGPPAEEEAVLRARSRAAGVAASLRRARTMPRHAGRELRDAAKATARGVTRPILYTLSAAAIALATIVVLTVALVQAFQDWMGAPGGTFVVAMLLAAGTLGALALARRERRRARQKARERLADLREEVRYVLEPAREAWGREPPRVPREW